MLAEISSVERQNSVEKFRSKKNISVNYSCFTILQRRSHVFCTIMRWKALKQYYWLLAVKYCCKTLHVRCLRGPWLRL